MSPTSTVKAAKPVSKPPVATPKAPTTMSVGDLKKDHMYRFGAMHSIHGYELKAGTYLVTGVDLIGYGGVGTDGILYVTNVENGRAHTYYPITKTMPIPAVPEPNGEALLEVAHRKYPGSYASFGAGMNLGTDPEVFVLGGDGGVLPAFTYLPDKVTALGRGWQGNSYHKKAASLPYWDGFQAEFNSVPFACIAHLTDTIQFGLSEVLREAQKVDKDAKLTGQSVLPVRGDTLASAESKHVELGCMPSENVYGHHGLQPGDGRTLPVRFAGFHMHFALGAAQIKRVPALVRMLDKLCGVLSVVTLQGLEDPIRRRYYGLAGEHRLPKHGLEWRVLSSAVLWHPALVHLHFNMARCAVQLADKGLDRLWCGSDEDAANVVDTLDVEGARRIIAANRDLYIGCLRDTYYNAYGTDDNANTERAATVLDHVILPGFAQHIQLDMEANWKLGAGKRWNGHSGSAGCQFSHYTLGFLKKMGKVSDAEAKALALKEREDA